MPPIMMQNPQLSYTLLNTHIDRIAIKYSYCIISVIITCLINREYRREFYIKCTQCDTARELLSRMRKFTLS